ncbi:MAG: D-sedoheptulose 7-phosphate isomerase, partial [Crocinitomicaceae bacterium]|jgi:D-sedoheptulose 7-phosphate isomerase|nr:D-sedoheptulose 7-phosphate isomerase [Crocinitomicaceae bacterium]
MSKETIRKHFDEAAEVLKSFNNDENQTKIANAIILMSEALSNGNKIISCGNGGSMCDAMHFAEELSGKFRNDRKGLAALSISDPSHITCVANDYGFDEIFSRYVEAVGNKGDILLGISTSGNSGNVINAVEVARKQGIKTIVLTGKTGGALAEIADLEIRAPRSKFADRAQEIHIKVIHTLIDGIERALKLS